MQVVKQVFERPKGLVGVRLHRLHITTNRLIVHFVCFVFLEGERLVRIWTELVRSAEQARTNSNKVCACVFVPTGCVRIRRAALER
jgi:hypothetical protein